MSVTKASFQLQRRTGLGIHSVLKGLLGNVALVAIKGLAGVAGNSQALIADAMESLLDTFQGVIVLGGLHIASAEPDKCHPYGHGKAEPLAAMVVALGVFAAGIGIGIASVQQMLSAHNETPAVWTLAVLVIVIVVKETLFRHIDSVGESIGSTAVKADAWHHRSDAITSAAAFIGILVAVIGGEGYEAADDWAALLACGIICINGFLLFRPALAEIMDAAPPEDWVKQVREVAGAVHDVSGLHTCKVRKMGLDLYVDIHVRVNGDISVRDGHKVAHDVKDALQEADDRIRDVLVHIEPDDIPSDEMGSES